VSPPAKKPASSSRLRVTRQPSPVPSGRVQPEADATSYRSLEHKVEELQIHLTDLRVLPVRDRRASLKPAVRKTLRDRVRDLMRVVRPLEVDGPKWRELSRRLRTMDRALGGRPQGAPRLPTMRTADGRLAVKVVDMGPEQPRPNTTKQKTSRSRHRDRDDVSEWQTVSGGLPGLGRRH
jgi:hypothetical protein